MPRTDFSISPYGRARCPVCRGEFSLTKKGVLRHHLGDIAIGRYRQVCEGVGRAPGVVTLPVAEAPAAPAEPAPTASIADRRCRLEADAEDAKKALWNAQRLYDRICNELAELRREEMGN